MTNHAIIFSGHMIDDPNRETPRFPADQEAAAIDSVRKSVAEIIHSTNGSPHGFASGACGGDIIFHEICLEKGIPSTIFLALEAEEFLDKSVRFAGEDWVNRFNTLCSRLPVLVLPEKNDDEKLSVWERTNEWIVEAALSYSSDPCSLIAIWDGKGGDGPGGTKHMVDHIKSLKQKTIIIDPAGFSSAT